MTFHNPTQAKIGASMTDDKKPLIGFMVMENYCEDLSEWNGQIAFPDPSGANLFWENPIKMIEHSAYAELQKQLEFLGKNNSAFPRAWDYVEHLESQLLAAEAKAADYEKALELAKAYLLEWKPTDAEITISVVIAKHKKQESGGER